MTWRRAQMVLLSAQGMPVAKIAEVTFTSADRVRDVIHNFKTRLGTNDPSGRGEDLPTNKIPDPVTERSPAGEGTTGCCVPPAD
ncbi:helix-turn-helix domain-containing protein [Streptomyces sp. NBC_00203]